VAPGGDGRITWNVLDVAEIRTNWYLTVPAVDVSSVSRVLPLMLEELLSEE
jgi:hypothetical protein